MAYQLALFKFSSTNYICSRAWGSDRSKLGAVLYGKTSASEQLCAVRSTLFRSASHVSSSLSDYKIAAYVAHHVYTPAVLCFFKRWLGCIPLLFLFDMLCVTVLSALHAVFGHARQRTVCHSVTATECQCVTYMLCLVMQGGGSTVTA